MLRQHRFSGAGQRGSRTPLPYFVSGQVGPQLGENDKLGVVVGGQTPCVLVDMEKPGVQLEVKTNSALRGLKNTNLGQGSLEQLLQCAYDHVRNETNIRIVVLTARERIDTRVSELLKTLPNNTSVSFLAYTTKAASHQLAQLVHLSGGNFGFIDTPKDLVNGLVEEFLSWRAVDLENFQINITAKDTLAKFSEPVLIGGENTEVKHTSASVVNIAGEKLRGGRTRNWVFQIHVTPPAKNHARAISIFTINVSYDKNGEHFEQTFNVKVKFGDTNGAKDSEIVEIVELAKLREQLIATSKLALEGHLSAARKILETQKWESDKVWSISSEINKSQTYGSTLQALTFSGVSGTMVYNSGLLGANATGWLPTTSNAAVRLVNKTMRELEENVEGEGR